MVGGSKSVYIKTPPLVLLSVCSYIFLLLSPFNCLFPGCIVKCSFTQLMMVRKLRCSTKCFIVNVWYWIMFLSFVLKYLQIQSRKIILKIFKRSMIRYVCFWKFLISLFNFFFHSELDEETGIIEEQVILYFHSMLFYITSKQFIYKFCWFKLWHAYILSNNLMFCFIL